MVAVEQNPANDVWNSPRSWQEEGQHDERLAMLSESQARWEGVMDTLHQTARRLRSSHPKADTVSSWSKDLYGDDLIGSHQVFWLTNHPERVYRMPTLYHVTGSPSLDALAKGEEIVPPTLHYKHNIVTHRQLGLRVLSAFLRQFNLQAGGKDDSLWAGDQIDNEQIALEHRIASTNDKSHETLFHNLFYTDTPTFSPFELNPTLNRVLQVLEDGGRPGEDPELREWIEGFMKGFHDLTLIREGWFTILKDRLMGEGIEYGTYTYPSLKASLSVDILMPYSLSREIKKRQRQQPSRTAQSVVLEVNPHRVFEDVLHSSPYPFIPGRDPDAIASLPFIRGNHITRVYAWDPETIAPESHEWMRNNGIELLPVDAIPKDALLDPNLPARMNPASVDPENPVCQMRYMGDSQAKWRERLLAGLMAPAGRQDFMASGHHERFFGTFGEKLITPDPDHPLWYYVEPSVQHRIVDTFIPGVFPWNRDELR